MVVDTSALMAVILEEPDAAACKRMIEIDADIMISAGTSVEALIVSGSRGLGLAMEALIDRLQFNVVPVSETSARKIAAAHQLWGRGRHRAKLDFGGCFSYALAKEYACLLLFVGDDFTQADIEPAITR